MSVFVFTRRNRGNLKIILCVAFLNHTKLLLVSHIQLDTIKKGLYRYNKITHS